MSAPLRRPLISVVTPVRDGARYLDDAIRSVRDQTLPALELVIVDGLSRDDSLAIARAHAARDPRIRVISEADQGLYDAVLKGLEATSAPLCCWLNADDRLMPYALELVCRHHALTGTPWMTGLPACMDQDGLLHTIEGSKWYPRALIRGGWFHGRALGFIQQEGTVFARALLERLDPATTGAIRATRQCGDTVLWRAFAAHAPLEVLPTVLGVFRLHGANLSSDPSAYFEELRAHRFPMPPAWLAAAMKGVFLPVAFWRHKRLLQRWRALAPRLPSLQEIGAAAEDDAAGRPERAPRVVANG